ncbi:MAG TPA: class I SAM-dependent methyltransferase [Pyrinomonadaceae bacterium]|nr:class I SAM-dependent methyltransferase [Pyrinomonadaceae bacterium]
MTSCQSSYWDRVATEKRFSHPLRVDWITHRLSPDARILDCGCGYGRTLAELHAAGYHNLTGLDFSEAMLRRCRSEIPDNAVVRNDGQSLPFKTHSVDAVLLFAVLTCIPHDGEQRALISEVERILRPDGLLYLSDLLVNDDQRNRERYDKYASPGTYGVFELPEGVVVRHHTVEWINEITSAFERLEYEPFTVTTMNGNASAAFQYLGRKPLQNRAR